MHKPNRHLILLMCTQVFACAHAMDQYHKNPHGPIPKQATLRKTKKETPLQSESFIFDTTGTPRELATRIAALQLRINDVQQQKSVPTENLHVLKAALDPHTKLFVSLHKKSEDITRELENQSKSRASLIAQERTIVLQEKRIDQFLTIIAMEARKKYSQELRDVLKDSSLPVESYLTDKKAELVNLIKNINETSRKLNKELNPLLTQQKALQEIMNPLNHKINEAQEQLKAHMLAESTAIAEKDCLTSALNNQLRALKERQANIQAVLDALHITITEEKDVDTKIALRTRAICQQRELSELHVTIQEIESVSAKPQESSSFFGWFNSK